MDIYDGSLWLKLVPRALAVGPMNAEQICAHYGVPPRRHVHAIVAVCERMQSAGTVSRIAGKRWEMVAMWVQSPGFRAA